MLKKREGANMMSASTWLGRALLLGGLGGGAACTSLLGATGEYEGSGGGGTGASTAPATSTSATTTDVSASAASSGTGGDGGGGGGGGVGPGTGGGPPDACSALLGGEFEEQGLGTAPVTIQAGGGWLVQRSSGSTLYATGLADQPGIGTLTPPSFAFVPVVEASPEGVARVMSPTSGADGYLTVRVEDNVPEPLDGTFIPGTLLAAAADGSDHFVAVKTAGHGVFHCLGGTKCGFAAANNCSLGVGRSMAFAWGSSSLFGIAACREGFILTLSSDGGVSPGTDEPGAREVAAAFDLEGGIIALATQGPDAGGTRVTLFVDGVASMTFGQQVDAASPTLVATAGGTVAAWAVHRLDDSRRVQVLDCRSGECTCSHVPGASAPSLVEVDSSVILAYQDVAARIATRVLP
jgi:hypothetical protein